MINLDTIINNAILAKVDYTHIIEVKYNNPQIEYRSSMSGISKNKKPVYVEGYCAQAELKKDMILKNI